MDPAKKAQIYYGVIPPSNLRRALIDDMRAKGMRSWLPFSSIIIISNELSPEFIAKWRLLGVEFREIVK